MNSSVCYVFGAGERCIYPPAPRKGDLIISADAGFDYACEEGLVSDWITGDFDSLEKVPDHNNIIPLSPEKDETDMLAAIKIGLSEGRKTFYIYGSLGGRFDHSYANIQCLSYLLSRGAEGILFGAGIGITLLQNGSLTFSSSYSGDISVFSWGCRAEGVSLRGFKYPLSDAVLTDSFPLGVSNRFTGTTCTAEVKKGTLMIVFPLNPGSELPSGAENGLKEQNSSLSEDGE